ncbi:MAG: GIY-YIG nuclease family protein [Candidatus Niyogibacteria bacterium]|nr:GIY-YIG nuclease family protein [Candidatus Niyogibacteria bacterium]
MSNVPSVLQNTKTIPDSPGVYFFRDRTGAVIYVGKAQNLKLRLNSYFTIAGVGDDARKQAMLKEATTFDWQELGSDIEALLREAELIKKLKPKYNVLMRDDKNYFYVGFTRGKFPRVFVTHQPDLDSTSSVYLGPYTDGGALKLVLKSLRKAFPYCECARSSRALHDRPCENAELGRCLGVCCLKKKRWRDFYPDAEERIERYRASIGLLKRILAGRHTAVLRRLKKDMRKLSEARHYEEAAELRDQIDALENIFEHRAFLSRDDQAWREKGLRHLLTVLGAKSVKRIEGYDISNIQGTDAVGSMVVFLDGLPAKNEYRRFRIHLPPRPNDIAMIREIVTRRLEHREWSLPAVMVIDGGKAQLNAAMSAALRFKKVRVVALAKREEELYLPNRTILKLKESSQPLLHLMQAVRNEAHRFALSFHRHRRAKTLFKKRAPRMVPKGLKRTAPKRPKKPAPQRKARKIRRR